jgi:hypothetical protein
MRYLIVILILLGSLVGCNQENESSDGHENGSANGKLQSEENSTLPRKNAGEYVSNPQVTDDRSLVNVGEAFSDEKGEAELKAFKKADEEIEVGPITLMVKEVKVLSYRPDYSLIDFFHSYTHDDVFDFVKVFVEIENKSNEPLNFAPAALLETDKGEKKTWEDDIYLEELNGKIRPGEKKAGNLGFIIEKSDLKFITITTSKVFDENEKELNSEKVIEVSF